MLWGRKPIALGFNKLDAPRAKDAVSFQDRVDKRTRPCWCSQLSFSVSLWLVLTPCQAAQGPSQWCPIGTSFPPEGSDSSPQCPPLLGSIPSVPSWVPAQEKHELWCWRRPLDIKEIKPVNPKGNKPWIFTGRIDAEAEAPILWPPDAKSRLTRKDPDAGEDEGRRRRVTEREMFAWHHCTQWTWVRQTLGEWRTGKPGILQFMTWQRVGHKWLKNRKSDEVSQWEQLNMVASSRTSLHFTEALSVI